jgi:hypothetical protein
VRVCCDLLIGISNALAKDEQTVRIYQYPNVYIAKRIRQHLLVCTTENEAITATSSWSNLRCHLKLRFQFSPLGRHENLESGHETFVYFRRSQCQIKKRGLCCLKHIVAEKLAQDLSSNTIRRSCNGSYSISLQQVRSASCPKTRAVTLNFKTGSDDTSVVVHCV